MTVPRFYHSGELASHREIFLDEAAAHHAARVLRLKQDDAVVLFNGKGGQYPARIAGIGKTKVTLLTGEWQDIERESALQVILAQGVSSAEKMDFTVQKATELGVTAIQPLASQRSAARMDAARARKRIEHWKKVVIAACEQCGRNRIPQIAEMVSLKKFLGNAEHDALRLMLSPEGGLSFRQLNYKGGEIILLAGAEGGFAPEEEQDARAAGFTPATLGRRVLRTETAGIAALAAMQTLWGDF
ncbi:MAG TPA: 16S rRNA (uracil(1498)-N(3))-methyltransferase [Burkholderiales bacterium]|nr:16S rRNA (uracil(1498)-N(3))-methyltransferase [Burkholderiales bacterium]